MSQPSILTPAHDLERVIELFRAPKFYHEGFIFRRTLLLADGSPPKRTDQNAVWAKYYVQIAGTTMSCWDAAEIEMAAQQGRQVAPTYTNITDARVDLPEPHTSAHSLDQLNSPSPHLFFLNNAGRNKFGFACSDPHSLLAWVCAIRLSCWERSRLFEIYTGTLLGLRFFNQLDSPPPNEKTEGYLTIRFPKDTEWTRVWAVLVRDKSLLSGVSPQNYHKENKWNRRGSLFNLAGLVNKTQHSPSSSGTLVDAEATCAEPGLIFYPKKGAKKHVGMLTQISFAAAVYPESRALVESSTMFKLEGRFEGIAASHDGRPSESQPASADQEGFILATPDEGTECDMLGWLLGVMSAFRLYGKPAKFNYDPTDPNSFYFAYPLGPERERLFLDCQTVAESLDVNEHSLAQHRQKLNSLVAARLHVPRKSVADSPESVQEPYESIVTTPQSIEEPLNYLSDYPPSQPAPKSVHQSSSPPPVTHHANTAAPESPASDANSSYSDPALTSEIPENDLRKPTSEPPSSDHHSRSPVTPLGQSDQLQVSKPARPLSTFDDELESYAAYVTYDDPVDTPDMPSSLLVSSPGRASSPSKSPTAKVTPTKPHSNNPSQPVSPSPQVPSQTATHELASEGFEDMLYALSLADQNSPAVPPLQDSTEPPNPARAPSTRSASPQLEFLSKPPNDPTSPQPNSAPISPEPQAGKSSFPSSFAAGKKSAARLAAAQAAQAAGKSSGFRPGKPGRTAPAGQKKPPSSWNNSDSDDDDDDDDENPNDDDEEDDEDEEDEEDDRLKKHRLTNVLPSSTSQVVSDRGFQPNQERKNMLHPQAAAGREGTYSMYSTSGPAQDGRPMSQVVPPGGGEMGQFPNAATRREVPAVLRDQPAESGVDTNGMRPAFSQHGLLHRVMQERQEKSAKSIQEAAHWTGEPLVQVNHKAPPIQSGLLGAIASHERDRKRDGGMGAVLTERARERALRQRETDELQRQSMYMMAGGPMGYPQAGYNQQAMMQMMYNPQMVAAGGMMPGGQMTYEQMMFQQHQLQLQQQAMINAQYMVAAPYGYPAVGQGGPGAPLMQPQQQVQAGPGQGMMSAHASMYGFPGHQMGFHQGPPSLLNPLQVPLNHPHLHQPQPPLSPP
ncbi:hypothetical protein PTTG_07151 [Puccinia triticina 1-1 BBBD Race 1]|uniref:PH domain-containing protein n=1 Tax=Puccinia triticina (isolate 1-1 / race 1 (BBBD)) TaxID=630390 RepID=A0A180G5U3_PUCT1|nr:hypothetical protein PTTG_07151 [Puccinia triticina 1-1 BBBD Race 1]